MVIRKRIKTEKFRERGRRKDTFKKCYSQPGKQVLQSHSLLLDLENYRVTV